MAVQYFQNDPRWEKKALGLNPNATIRDFGCLLTSMTMVANHFGGNYTPESYNEVMKQNGGFAPGQQWIKTFAISKVLPNVKYQKSVECPDSPAPLADIDGGLAAGSLVVVNVDRDSKDTTFSPADGHWVVIHKKQGNDYLIWDPYKSEGAAETLVGRYGFGFKNAAQIIKQAIWFGIGDFPAQGASATPTQPATPKPPATPTTPSTPPAGGKLTVRTTGDQVSLRTQPVVATNTLIRTMPKGTTLEVTEGGNAAAKVGAQNQWLKVKAGDGKEGYVAAWFVA